MHFDVDSAFSTILLICLAVSEVIYGCFIRPIARCIADVQDFQALLIESVE